MPIDPNPELAAAARAEGAAAFKSQDFLRAAQLFGRAVALGGADAHALHCNRAAALSALDKHDAALEASRQALLVQPRFYKAHCAPAADYEPTCRRWRQYGAAHRLSRSAPAPPLPHRRPCFALPFRTRHQPSPTPNPFFMHPMRTPPTPMAHVVDLARISCSPRAARRSAGGGALWPATLGRV